MAAPIPKDNLQNNTLPKNIKPAKANANTTHSSSARYQKASLLAISHPEILKPGARPKITTQNDKTNTVEPQSHKEASNPDELPEKTILEIELDKIKQQQNQLKTKESSLKKWADSLEKTASQQKEITKE